MPVVINLYGEANPIVYLALAIACVRKGFQSCHVRRGPFGFGNCYAPQGHLKKPNQFGLSGENCALSRRGGDGATARR